MALVEYTKKYWFPTGVLAANEPAAIFPENSNFHAAIYSDIVGTPLANPTTTDPAGVLTFWAEEGQYWVHIDTEAFAVDVGMTQAQAEFTTGVASGGRISVNAFNPQAIDIAPLVGYVVSNNQLTSAVPTIVKVDTPAQTVVLDAAAQTRALTNWLMDSTGAVIQQEPPPTAEQRRTHLQLGTTLYDPGSGVIVESQSIQVILGQPGNQWADLVDYLGPFSTSGNELTPLAGTLSFGKAVGTMFARSLNHYAAGVLTDNPHVSVSPLQSPALFKRVIRTAESPLPPDVTTVDPTQYDLNGVLTLVGGGTNTATVQRVYVTPSDVPSARMAVQYGQQTYASLAAAVAAVGTAPFIPNPISGFGPLIGYIAMIRVATNLADPAQAVFIRPTSKFPTH